MSDNNNSPIASCTGRILVVKDGKDGVGIKSADAIFAVYSHKTSEPADDYEGWKSSFKDLVLLPDCYVWSALRVTNTDGKIWITGKRCLGSTSDFASIKQLYALGDSKNTPPTDGWSETYTPIKGKYLWAKNELTLQNVAVKIYTTPICIGYFATDGINGTSFNPKGTADAHYTNYKEYKDAQQGPIQGELYLIDTVTDKYPDIVGPVYITYDKLITGNEVISKTDKGDAYIINKDIWVNNGDAWVDFGDIQGPEGAAGKDAPWIVFSNNPVVFETNKEGKIDTSSKQVDMMAYLGKSIITKDCTFTLEASSGSSFDITKASLSNTDKDTATVNISSEGIAIKKVGDYEVPYPNSSLMVKVNYEDYVIKVTINIVTDTSLVDGYFRTSIEGLEAQYTEMETSVKDNSALLTLHQASISANAESIKHKVSQTDFDDQNKETSSKFSELNQTAAGISQRVEAIEGDHVTKAEISAFVKKNNDGTLESGVKINADNINIDSSHEFNINGNYFSVTSTNFNVGKSGISYNDTEKSTSWNVEYSDNGLKMNFTNNDTSAVMYASEDRGASLWMTKEKKSMAIYSNDYIGIFSAESAADQLNYVIDFGIPATYGVGYLRSTPRAGVIMEVLKKSDYLRFILAGLPKSDEECTNGGQIYVENGFLKIKQ